MAKINSLEIENVKRVKLVTLEPTANGLTILGGKNKQGKTSVLDAITWALGGEKFRPTNPQREGSTLPPHIKITLDNGLVVERSGKNSSLKVMDPEGRKAGQKLIDSFVESFALNLPAFMEMNDREKAKVLLNILGIGEQLMQMDNDEKLLYNRRTEIGRIADQKLKYAQEMPQYTDAPTEPVSVSDLIAQQQEILARNGENQRKRMQLSQITNEKNHLFESLRMIDRQLEELKSKKETMMQEYSKACNDEMTALKSISELVDESTAEIEESIRNIEAVNTMVRANCEREKAEIDADTYVKQRDELTEQIETIRVNRLKLLDGAQMPLAELSVRDGALIYKGQAWDCMSGAEQMIVAASIVRKLNPNCEFVLLDKLEQMDMDTLAEFGKWLESEGLQAIATRVSTGEECSVIIDDGMVQNTDKPSVKSWKAGEF
ncbi:MAG: AAA family ATPase [Oscillospiraceae bacterium]|nr:AAA family ATPase [Oscillospiraceae bacterium]